MGATVFRHSLAIRLHRLALAGVTGFGLWGGLSGTGPALAGEPAGPSPRPAHAHGHSHAHAQTDGPSPAAPSRGTHAPYFFFMGDGRTTYHPVKGQVPAAPAAGQTSKTYQFFVPGKKIAARTTHPGPHPIPDPERAISGVGVADQGEGIPLPPSQRSLIFFTPNGSAAKPGAPPVAHLAARADLRKPARPATLERVPVRLPDTPRRKPQPYLIFQPTPNRARPASSPKAGGTAPSTSTTPRSATNDGNAVPPPKPAGRGTPHPQADAGTPRPRRSPNLAPSTDPAPPPVQRTARATAMPPVRSNQTTRRIAPDPPAGIVGNRQSLRSR